MIRGTPFKTIRLSMKPIEAEETDSEETVNMTETHDVAFLQTRE